MMFGPRPIKTVGPPPLSHREKNMGKHEMMFLAATEIAAASVRAGKTPETKDIASFVADLYEDIWSQIS